MSLSNQRLKIQKRNRKIVSRRQWSYRKYGYLRVPNCTTDEVPLGVRIVYYFGVFSLFVDYLRKNVTVGVLNGKKKKKRNKKPVISSPLLHTCIWGRGSAKTTVVRKGNGKRLFTITRYVIIYTIHIYDDVAKKAKGVAVFAFFNLFSRARVHCSPHGNV